MAIGTVLEDHFLFIICQVKLLMSSVRREAAYHDHWGRGVVRRVGLLCPVTVRSVICVTWLSWERVTCHESPAGEYSLSLCLWNLMFVAIPRPHLPLFGIWAEMSWKKRRVHWVRSNEKSLKDERKISLMMIRYLLLWGGAAAGSLSLICRKLKKRCQCVKSPIIPEYSHGSGG